MKTRPATAARTPFLPGDRLVCIDDTGWLIPDPGFEHLAPKKGEVYTLREYRRFGGSAAISLMESHKEHFYRASRFRHHKA